MQGRLDRDFFRRDVLEVAPDLLGKHLVMKDGDKGKSVYTITETEAYRGSTVRRWWTYIHVSDLWNTLDAECG